MASEIIIRRMTMADVDGVAAVEAATFPTPWSRDAFASEMNNVAARYLVAEKDGREQRRIASLRAEGILRPRAPLCSHCSCRLRYFSPASRWECPSCGSACNMLGQPLSGPGISPVSVSPRQRPN